MEKNNKLIVVCGPTSSGKSALAFELAKKFRGEIVLADSRQVYRGLDIGTAKAGPTEQKLVPHHLINVVPPGDNFSVAGYKKLAVAAIADIHDRGNNPFLEGGTGLYLDAITQGLAIPAIPPDPKLRARLEKQSPAELLVQLRKLDPAYAQEVDAQNPRRLVRALEVCLKSGRPYSAARQKTKVPYEIIYLAVNWPRTSLYQRIDRQVDRMLAVGLKQEIAHLLTTGVSPAWLIKLGLEYKFITPVVLNKAEEKAAVQKLKFASHQFAKRQLTWFRRNKKIRWLKPATALPEATKQITEFLRN
jgi:tRNA dimethylallyltransferase